MIARKKMQALPLGGGRQLKVQEPVLRQKEFTSDPFMRFVVEWKKEIEQWQDELVLLHKLARRTKMAQKKHKDKKNSGFPELEGFMHTGIIQVTQKVQNFESELIMMHLNKDVSASRKLQKFEELNLLIRNFESGLKTRRMQFLEELYNTIPVTIF